jgi:hypothetical protein
MAFLLAVLLSSEPQQAIEGGVKSWRLCMWSVLSWSHETRGNLE